MSEIMYICVCEKWQHVLCLAWARRVEERLWLYTSPNQPRPAAALAPCIGPCAGDTGQHHGTWQCPVLSPLILLLHLLREGRVKPQQFFFPLPYFLPLLELLELCTSGSIHSQQFRFSFFPSLEDTFPESCCGAWPRCQQDRAPGSPNSLIPTANTQLGFNRIASESSRSPH